MPERELTILFADLVGSTELSMSLEAEEDYELKSQLRDKFVESLGEFGGTFRKSMGDGFLITFEDATEAVEYAIHTQRKIQKWRAEKAAIDVTFRIGLHTGTVTVDEDGDLYGANVNIAARIEGQAAPDEIYISRNTFYELADEIDVIEIGRRPLKGVEGQTLLYQIDYKKYGRHRPWLRRLFKDLTVSSKQVKVLLLIASGLALFSGLIWFGSNRSSKKSVQASKNQVESEENEYKNVNWDLTPYPNFALSKLKDRSHLKDQTEKNDRLLITKVYNDGIKEIIEIFNPTSDTQYLVYLGELSPGLELHEDVAPKIYSNGYLSSEPPVNVSPCSYFTNVSETPNSKFDVEPEGKMDSSLGCPGSIRLASWKEGDEQFRVDSVGWIGSSTSNVEIPRSYFEGEPVRIERATQYYLRRKQDKNPVDTDNNSEDFELVELDFSSELPEIKQGYSSSECPGQ